MKKEPLLQIFERLSDYCQEYKVLSEGELSVKIRECLQALSDAERAELEKRLGGNVKALIFKSITSTDKISVFSPDMHTRINYQGEVFYCLPTHGYLAEELEEAFLRWTKIRSPLSALKDLITDFLERCNYEVKDETSVCENEHCELIAVKKNKTTHRDLHLFIFSSIKFVPLFIEAHHAALEKTETEEKVIVVPTEKTPAPFISFVREHEVGGVMIWVADVEKRTVNPFIGTPNDPKIEKNFANPEQARRAVNVWMKKMHFFDL
ncbi:MAG TPA: hypothetical protein VMW40_02325 [Candidatus Bathyarchaeia archaeon]|nr:hypothetical protein [Candidatus Bathyarchaeia archaeon]